MDIVKPLLDVACLLWDCTAGHASYITDLQETLSSLKTKMEELIAIRDDLKLKVQSEEQQGHIPSRQVKGLLKTVEETDIMVKKILSEHEDISKNGSTCLGMCRCRSSYKLGKKSRKLLIDIQELINKWGSSEVAFQQPYPAPTRETKGLCEIPVGSQNLLGVEFHLEKVLEGLKDDNVGIIGLYGMGGVGKTTLLIKINNELPKTGDDAFDCSLWIVASENATIETIQQKVLRKLEMSLSSKSTDEIRNEIYNNLKNKKYILMLDDVWEMLDLFEGVGIPKPDNSNKSKIMFTTRLKGVCFQMGAQLITEVACLPWDFAWSLFQEKVGKATLSPQIETYAMKVANECNGLPLALITIGRAMSGKVEPREWSHALHQLQNYPAEIPDLEKKVFPKLQLSYDYLSDSTKQKCFLYCSLFPEDSYINRDKLVNLWMGEGYLNTKHDIKRARDYGYSIIEDLKRACLLESEIASDCDTVKMHDVISDMALWIAKKEFLILDKAELMREKFNYQEWNEDVEKMSLWGSETYLYESEEGNSTQRDQEKLTLTCECPKLSTLMFKESPMVSLSGLFNCIPKVRVLDLSENILIEFLPEAISKLVYLEYLDISKTRVERLPKEMKSLSKLKYLIMNSTDLKELPTEIISGLNELFVFLLDCNLPFPEKLLRGLQEMRNIQEISICLDSAETMYFLLNSEKLQLCTKNMQLGNSFEELNWCPSNLRNLESLFIRFSNLVALKCISRTTTELMVFNSLCSVQVFYCDCLVELDFLAFAPFLVKLRVEYCRSIQRILRVEEGEHVFLSLECVYLNKLPCLEYICNEPLTFPNLKIIEVLECPKLEQNPLNDMLFTNTKLRLICGDRQWWDSLKWRDDVLMHHFSQFFTDEDDADDMRKLGYNFKRQFDVVWQNLRCDEEVLKDIWKQLMMSLNFKV